MRNEFIAIVERDRRWHIAYCPEIPGANGQGKTKAAALKSNEPAHVHVERESNTCKFWLEPIELARSHGFSAHELNVVRRIIRAQRGKILEAWHEHCG